MVDMNNPSIRASQPYSEKRQKICDDLESFGSVCLLVAAIFGIVAIPVWIGRFHSHLVSLPPISAPIILSVISAVSGVSGITALVAKIILGRTKRVEVKLFAENL